VPDGTKRSALTRACPPGRASGAPGAWRRPKGARWRAPVQFTWCAARRTKPNRLGKWFELSSRPCRRPTASPETCEAPNNPKHPNNPVPADNKDLTGHGNVTSARWWRRRVQWRDLATP